MTDDSVPPPSYEEVLRQEGVIDSPNSSNGQTSTSAGHPSSSSSTLPNYAASSLNSRPVSSSGSGNAYSQAPYPPARPTSQRPNSWQPGNASTMYASPPPSSNYNTAKPPYQTSQFYARPQSSYAPPPSGRPRISYPYPPGYMCYKCHNTGYKDSGRPCGRCARRFGRSYDVQFSRPPPGALVVYPGDPRIPGRVCGNCKGSGQLDFIFFTEICPVCNGVGKIPY
ncbi:Proline/serine-rich protein C17A5.10 [Schizosaccharomyces pombe]|uniref:Proline/serine-rich protein C17A5.10 n=1 Tax=Schizosaccharomyces pombe (strain 972 / ATCC 24843) TaxID=284812 RepID=HUA1_SCHPO|nr:uncharacterized protein SPAC17A5.10 [Schizosaccharomyces pombe]O13772.1 RecName: Full=Proline/serine-rich protein C17A5.10 [Schizosaccharomyces pombe 972h-]CAB11510.1 conserved fungal protein [Schizosaccharomyces pombe]|eukprot:NP_593478.1 uncharacterized protein SPAC17A5.10 [Schizosaccharomyces pombe]